MSSCLISPSRNSAFTCVVVTRWSTSCVVNGHDSRVGTLLTNSAIHNVTNAISYSPSARHSLHIGLSYWQNTDKTRQPSLEVAPTTLTQRTRQTTKIHNVLLYIHSRKRNIFILWPRTLTFELDVHRTKMMPEYSDQRSLNSKVIVNTHRHTHTPDRLLYMNR